MCNRYFIFSTCNDGSILVPWNPHFRFCFYLRIFFLFCLQMSRLALWAVWYWRIMSRPTTRTFPQVFPILLSMNVSITLETPHCSSVPPLVSFYSLFVASVFFFPVSLLEMMYKKTLTTNADICIRTVWSSSATKDAHKSLDLNSVS